MGSPAYINQHPDYKEPTKETLQFGWDVVQVLMYTINGGQWCPDHHLEAGLPSMTPAHAHRIRKWLESHDIIVFPGGRGPHVITEVVVTVGRLHAEWEHLRAQLGFK